MSMALNTDLEETLEVAEEEVATLITLRNNHSRRIHLVEDLKVLAHCCIKQKVASQKIKKINTSTITGMDVRNHIPIVKQLILAQKLTRID